MPCPTIITSSRTSPICTNKCRQLDKTEATGTISRGTRTRLIKPAFSTRLLVPVIAPVLTWLVVGPVKFLINSARQRQWAFNLVGNGGFPSNHSAVVSSMATLIALRVGMGHPAFGVAVTLAFIVMIAAFFVTGGAPLQPLLPTLPDISLVLHRAETQSSAAVSRLADILLETIRQQVSSNPEGR